MDFVKLIFLLQFFNLASCKTTNAKVTAIGDKSSERQTVTYKWEQLMPIAVAPELQETFRIVFDPSVKSDIVWFDRKVFGKRRRFTTPGVGSGKLWKRYLCMGYGVINKVWTTKNQKGTITAYLKESVGRPGIYAWVDNKINCKFNYKNHVQIKSELDQHLNFIAIERTGDMLGDENSLPAQDDRGTDGGNYFPTYKSFFENNNLLIREKDMEGYQRHIEGKFEFSKGKIEVNNEKLNVIKIMIDNQTEIGALTGDLKISNEISFSNITLQFLCNASYESLCTVDMGSPDMKLCVYPAGTGDCDTEIAQDLEENTYTPSKKELEALEEEIGGEI